MAMESHYVKFVNGKPVKISKKEKEMMKRSAFAEIERLMENGTFKRIV